MHIEGVYLTAAHSYATPTHCAHGRTKAKTLQIPVTQNYTLHDTPHSTAYVPVSSTYDSRSPSSHFLFGSLLLSLTARFV
jgi:hypothetical protein